MEMGTAIIPVDKVPANTKAFDEAIYSYFAAAKLSKASLVEYDRHLKTFPENTMTYIAHIDTINATGALAQADGDYLAAIKASGAERSKLLADAVNEYNLAWDAYGLVILRYYTDDAIIRAVFPKGFDKRNVTEIPVTQRRMILNAAHAAEGNRQDQYSEDRQEFDGYIRRIMLRLQQISH